MFNIKQINELLDFNLEKFASVNNPSSKKELNKDHIDRIILEFIM